MLQRVYRIKQVQIPRATSIRLTPQYCTLFDRSRELTSHRSECEHFAPEFVNVYNLFISVTE